MQNIATMKPQSYNSSISDSPIWSTAVVALALSFWRHRRLKKAETKEISSLVGESKAGQRCFRLASISCLSVSDFMRPPNPYIFTFILWGLNFCHTRFDAFLSQRSREADLVSSTEKKCLGFLYPLVRDTSHVSVSDFPWNVSFFSQALFLLSSPMNDP